LAILNQLNPAQDRMGTFVINHYHQMIDDFAARIDEGVETGRLKQNGQKLFFTNGFIKYLFRLLINKFNV
jgi:hypothetical protein